MGMLRPACKIVLLLGLVVAGSASPRAAAAERKPAAKTVPDLIDRLIDSALAKDGITPAAQADDPAIIRRTTLDLVGRIPTLPEVEAYVKSTDPEKRAKLVDALMATPGYARYQATQFDVMLGVAEVNRRRGPGNLRDYLYLAVSENRPWDRMFRELMLPDDSKPNLKGASDFLRPRMTDLDRLTNDVSISFFGVNVSCAQCHDHPLVKDWTQDHYYGMKSFLARSFEKNGKLGEQQAGTVKFKPNKGAEKTAKMMFLTGAVVEDPSNRELTPAEIKAAKGTKRGRKVEDDSPPPAAPAFSARAKLVEVALNPKNVDLFARAIVNRLWHRFLGYGLVNPLDQMHSENPASHPEVLAGLASDLVEHDYNLNRLVRGLVLSQTYSRDSRYSSESLPEPRFFAVGRLKPLTPIQLATSLRIAASDPATFEGQSAAELDKKMEKLEASAGSLAAQLAQPTDNFQIGVSEALLFSNSSSIASEYLRDGGGSLIARALALKDPNEAVEFMVKAVLGRESAQVERDALVSYIEKRGKRADAYRQALWALCTSSEFRFNH